MRKILSSFPRTFWVANTLEVLERLAFYSFFAIMSLFLTKRAGFNDVETGIISGVFTSLLYILPIPTGTIADKISFKRALMIAFTGLGIGYGIMGFIADKLIVLISLGFVAIGGAFIKPTITGTVARTSTRETSTRGFAIFYMMVNCGALAGKLMASPLRIYIDIQYVCIASSISALIALGAVLIFYKEPSGGGEHRSVKETLFGMVLFLKNIKLIIFLIIFSGFWSLFGQWYFTTPKYITRVISLTAPYELILAINPATIVLFQLLVERFSRRFSPIKSMFIGVFIASIGITSVSIYPSLWMSAFAVFIFAFGEMHFAPRYFDYIAGLAPEGKKGLYMGFAQLPAFFGKLGGGALSGIILKKYCPESGDTSSAYIMWLIYGGIGFCSAFLLLIYQIIFPNKDPN